MVENGDYWMDPHSRPSKYFSHDEFVVWKKKRKKKQYL